MRLILNELQKINHLDIVTFMLKFALKWLATSLLLCTPGFALLQNGLTLGITLGIDPLYWQAMQPQMDYAVEGLTTAGRGNPLNQTPHWFWGFRLHAATDLVSCMDIHIGWTSFRNQNSTSASASVGLFANQLAGFPFSGILPDVGVIQFPQGGAAGSTWFLHFDMIDLDLLFPLFDGPLYEIHPYIGVKGGWIRQQQEIIYTNFSDTSFGVPNTIDAILTQNNRFWGVGPKAGCAGSTHLTDRLRLMGGIGGALLMGQLHSPFFGRALVSLPSLGTTIPSVVDAEIGTWRLIPTLQLFVGVDWRFVWSRCQALLGVGYEVQYFWNTWRLQSSLSQLQIGTTVGFSSLMFQGVTTRFGIHF